MATQQEKLIYFMRKAQILCEQIVDENGDDDLILPLGANRVFRDVVDALEEEISRANDYEEYDPG